MQRRTRRDRFRLTQSIISTQNPFNNSKDMRATNKMQGSHHEHNSALLAKFDRAGYSYSSSEQADRKISSADQNMATPPSLSLRRSSSGAPTPATPDSTQSA